MNESINKYVSKLPKSPGVYKFYDAKNRLIYIGKATSLRNRVRSYFIGAHDIKTEKLVSEIKKIKFERTETVLEAIILESNLIKKKQPKYNIKEKDDKSFSYLLITKNEDFPRVIIVRKTDLGKYQSKKIFGPYVSKKQIEIALKIIRKILPFHSRKQKTEKGCLDFQLGRCPGPYAGAIGKIDYQKNIRGIELILSGKKKTLIKKLEKEMENFSEKNEFEKAADLRNKISALKHIQDVALINSDLINIPSLPFRQAQFSYGTGQTGLSSLQKRERTSSSSLEGEIFESLKPEEYFRIEGYDISNIGGDYAVGSMVVFTNKKADKSQYRRFKIKTISGINDIAMMKEVLTRRIKRTFATYELRLATKKDWPKPNLILIDGGKVHLNMAEKLLRDAGWDVPIAAIAKGPTRKKLDLYYTKNAHRHFEIISDIVLLEKIRNEAHRFAIAYHRKLRRRNWISKI